MASGGLYLGAVSLTGGVSNLNTNIYASNGDALTDTMGALNVNVSNASAIPVSEASLDGCISSNQVAVADATLDACVDNQQVVVRIGSTPVAHTPIQNGTFTTLGKPGVLAFQVGSQYCRKVCIFGNVSALAGGTTPVNISIGYSDDGSTWYKSSLGDITISTADTDFSRDWETSAQWVGIWADSAATAVIYADLSA